MQPLLDRGVILAFAHTRGGGDLGKAWHIRGRKYNKMLAVEDFLSCAEALKGYLTGDTKIELIARGFSAGGIIVGCAMNLRPELFDKVVLTNAFLDVEATMRNPSLHLTQHEWDEYGNPLHDAKAAKAIASYCPVNNANSCDNLPEVLLVGTLDDDQVPFWNALIYGTKLRDKTDHKKVSIYIESTGGHHLEGDSRLRVSALEASFILGDSA
jgi:oligopeptidase B